MWIISIRNARGFGSTVLSIGIPIGGGTTESRGIYNRSDWGVGNMRGYLVECDTKWDSGMKQQWIWTTPRMQFKPFIIAWKDGHLKKRNKRKVCECVCSRRQNWQRGYSESFALMEKDTILQLLDAFDAQSQRQIVNSSLSVEKKHVGVLLFFQH